MRPTIVVLALFVLAGGYRAAPARAQETPKDRGEKWRAELSKGPDERLRGELRLGAYFNTARVGFLTFKTDVVETAQGKLYRIEDRLDADATGFGQLKLVLQAELGPDLGIRSLSLVVDSPDAQGALSHRQLDVLLENGKLVVTEIRNEAKPVRRTLDVPAGLVPLAPPVGAGDRLARLAALAGLEGELSLPALDLETLERTTVKLDLKKGGKVTLHGQDVPGTRAVRREAAAELDEWIGLPSEAEKQTDPQPLVIVGAGARRLSFVGREPPGVVALPPTARETEDRPATAVLRFLRACGAGDRKTVEALLDLETPPAAKDDPALQKQFRQVLVDKLVSDDWRRGGVVALIAGAATVDDLEEKVEGEKATVGAKGATAKFELRKSATGWRIARLPAR